MNNIVSIILIIALVALTNVFTVLSTQAFYTNESVDGVIDFSVQSNGTTCSDLSVDIDFNDGTLPDLLSQVGADFISYENSGNQIESILDIPNSSEGGSRTYVYQRISGNFEVSVDLNFELTESAQVADDFYIESGLVLNGHDTFQPRIYIIHRREKSTIEFQVFKKKDAPETNVGPFFSKRFEVPRTSLSQNVTVTLTKRDNLVSAYIGENKEQFIGQFAFETFTSTNFNPSLTTYSSGGEGADSFKAIYDNLSITCYANLRAPVNLCKGNFDGDDKVGLSDFATLAKEYEAVCI